MAVPLRRHGDQGRITGKSLATRTTRWQIRSGPQSIEPEHREHHFACSFFSPAIVIGHLMNAEECYNGMEQQPIYPEAICLNP